MTDPISTHNRMRGNAVGTESKTGAGVKSGESTRPATTTKASGGSTIVELTNATVLEELREQIDSMPEVNEARVEAVKRSLTNGEYQPDAEVIARKYSEIEKLLP